MRRLAACLLVVATACGADKPSPALTAPPPAAGFTRVIGAGFTIDMPAGWHQPPLEPGAFDQTAAALREKNPRLAAALQQARAGLARGTRLFAIDPVDGSSVNLIVVDSTARSLKAVVAQARQELEQAGAGGLRSEDTTLGTRPAVRLDFDLTVTGPSGSLRVPETQYYALRDKTLFILTLFGGSPDLGTVAESLRIT